MHKRCAFMYHHTASTFRRIPSCGRTCWPKERHDGVSGDGPRESGGNRDVPHVTHAQVPPDQSSTATRTHIQTATSNQHILWRRPHIATDRVPVRTERIRYHSNLLLRHLYIKLVNCVRFRRVFVYKLCIQYLCIQLVTSIKCL